MKQPMDDTQRNSAVYEFLQLNYAFICPAGGAAAASLLEAIETPPRFRAEAPLCFDHYLDDLHNDLRFDHGRVDDEMIVSGVPHVRLEVLFYQSLVFLFQLGDVLSRITLRKSKFSHRILYP